VSFPSNLDTYTENPVYYPFALVKLVLAGGTYRLFSGIGELTWDGQTWAGAGDLGYIGKIESTAEAKAGKVVIGLSGLDASLKAEALDELSRGGSASIYFGFFSDAENTITYDPWLGFFGRVDTSEVEEDAEGVEVRVTLLDSVGARLRQTVRRRTDSDQQEIYSGDEFYSYVAALRDPENWGGSGSSGAVTNNPGGRGGNSGGGAGGFVINQR